MEQDFSFPTEPPPLPSICWIELKRPVEREREMNAFINEIDAVEKQKNVYLEWTVVRDKQTRK